MSDKRRTFAVIDGNSLMHRAFHAVPPTMNAPDGRPTNAIFGFLNMFLKMIDAFNPDGVVVAFDKGKPRVRMEMLPQYKAQRPPMDPDLHAQFPMIKELLTALNVPILQSEGWEGDDILGTMARLGEQAGCDMLLVTGDRDMYQLVTEHVNVVSTRKGLSDVAIMTPESVDDLYHGITPALVPDFYGLKGDTSDNIPGVPGIGPKKASALIAKYGSLDEVIAHADEVKGKMGENLRAHIDDALLSRKVATIRTDAPVELDFEATSFPAFSADEVSAALGTLGITAMQNRFLALIGGEGGAAAASSVFEIPAMVRAAAGDADALGAVAAEVSHAIDAGEWVAAVVDDDKEEGALFGLTRTLWLATSKGLFALEEGDSCAAAEVEGFNFAHGVIAGVLMAIIYCGLGLAGMQLGTVMPDATNGAAILARSASMHFGLAGTVVVFAIFFLACMNVCIGLISCCSRYFCETYVVEGGAEASEEAMRRPFAVLAFVFAAFSCVLSNVGLDVILMFSVPMLNALYPVAIVLVLMGLVHGFCDAHPQVWIWVGGVVAVQSVITSVRDAFFAGAWLPFDSLPLADIGAAWAPVAVVAFVIGLLHSKFVAHSRS